MIKADLDKLSVFPELEKEWENLIIKTDELSHPRHGDKAARLITFEYESDVKAGEE